MLYAQSFILKDSLIHFWKIKKVGGGHIQPYCKAVQSSERNILCLSRHNVLYDPFSLNFYRDYMRFWFIILPVNRQLQNWKVRGSYDVAGILEAIKEADTEESMELFKQYPELAQQCAKQIQKELDKHTAGHAVTYDGADYQRLVDRGEKEIVG